MCVHNTFMSLYIYIYIYILSGLSQNNKFREHSGIMENKTKLGISGGAKASGSLGFDPLQSNPLKP